MTVSPVTTRRAALVLLCSVQFLVVLDVTIVAVALPAIRRDLGFSNSGLQWVLTAYALVFGGLLVAAGRAGDLIGRRRALRAGLVVFGAASLGCGLAASPAVLVALRALQGAGAALVAPAALALLTAAFPAPAERRRAVAWWTAAAAGGGASGWVLGGLLVDGLGWPTVFLVNVPVCAAAAAVAPLLLAERRAARAGRELDLAGAAAVTGGLALLVHGLSRAEAGDAWAAASLAAAPVALAGFARIEQRATDPILPPAALRRPGFAAATGAALALTATTTPAMFLALLYQQEVLGRGALATGLWCAPFNVAVVAGSLLGPRAAARWAPGTVMAAGLVAVAAGALVLCTLQLLPAFALMGAGLGCAAVASTSAGTAALAEEQQGVASGVLNAAAQVGSAIGLALLVGVASALGAGWGFAGAAALALAVAAAITRSSRPSRRRPTTRHP